jgi:hypothetical protein
MTERRVAMKKMRILSILITVMFFFSWVVPPVLAEEAGDKMAEIFKKDIKPPVDLLPEGVEVVEGFEPGEGASIGSVKKAVGKVLVVHQGAKTAYVLKKGTLLFTGDTLISSEESSLYSKLKDKSEFTLAAYSKIVLDKSIYDPDKNSRDSLLRLMFGKARFIVKTLSKKDQENYRVKTPTAILGVRGSDFALSVVPVDALSVSRWDWIEKLGLIGTAHAAPAGPILATTIVTGKKTTVSFAGNVGPTQIVEPLQISQAIAGMAAIAPMAVSAAVVFGAISSASAAAGATAGAGLSTAAIIGIGVAVAAGGAAVAAGGGDDGGGGGITAETLVGNWYVTEASGTTSEWHMYVDLRSDNTFSETEYVNGTPYSGTGSWSYDSSSRYFVMDVSGGGDMGGTISGSINDFYVDGHWANGDPGYFHWVRQ